MDPQHPGLTRNLDLNYAQSLGLEVQAQKPLWEQNTLTIGGDYRHDLDIVLCNVDVEPPATYLNTHQSPDIVGVYRQDEFALRTNLLLNAGVRYTSFSAFGDTINPRAALIYHPLPSNTLK